MLEIKGQPKGEIEVKRLYLQGVNINYICPVCGDKDMCSEYFSYPDINKPITIKVWCRECGHEWDEKVKINLTIEAL
jgi:uncharacterized Zn finger protein